MLQSLMVPDRHGRFADVTLGYDTLAGYLADRVWFGAIVGRYANRIAYGRFVLDGTVHTLPVNQPPHHLHGGRRGFSCAVWNAEPASAAAGPGVVFSHTSADGDQGYPGTLRVRVACTFTDDDELIYDYLATTDAATPVNLTQHSYFNLAGHGAGHVLDHRLTLRASHYAVVDAGKIPTGEIRRVTGSLFDFTTPRPIGSRMREPDEQLRHGGGYDHAFVLDAPAASGQAVAATLAEPISGRVLEIYTTEPAIQLYTGNALDGIRGKDGNIYCRYAGIALETQHLPDSPNRPEFPNTILRPGMEYTSRTRLRFLSDGTS